MSALMRAIENCTEERVKFWKGRGVKMMWCKQQQGETVFVPSGWAMVECAVSDGEGALHYGCRKSFMLSDSSAHDAFKGIIQLLSRDKVNTERMQAVLEVTKPPLSA